MKKKVVVFACVVVLCISLFAIINFAEPTYKYNQVEKNLQSNDFSKALDILSTIEDSSKKQNVIVIAIETALESKDVKHARLFIELLAENVDVSKYESEIIYLTAEEEKDCLSALKRYESIADYKDANKLADSKKEEVYQAVLSYIENGDYDKAQTYINGIVGYKNEAELQKIIYYNKALTDEKNLDYVGAKFLLKLAKGYAPADKKLKTTLFGLVGNKYYVKNSASYIVFEEVLTDKTIIKAIAGPFRGQVLSEYTEEYFYKIEGNTLYRSTYDEEERETMFNSNWTLEHKLENIQWKNGKVYSFRLQNMDFVAEPYN